MHTATTFFIGRNEDEVHWRRLMEMTSVSNYSPIIVTTNVNIKGDQR